ncbi:MAG TPA: ABC transporter permease [Candidatus Acetothermia bacterium]|nr:ABC transporter permease [Candidatus Acetothermia bacterium]
MARQETHKRTFFQTSLRLLRYVVIRGLSVGVSVVIGVYLTIYIANMGGYVDKIKESEIREQVAMSVHANPQYKFLPPSKQKELIAQQVELEKKRLGLDKPFLYRSGKYLVQALSLNLGRAQHLTSDSGSRRVWLILAERLPVSVLLFGTANLILFFLGVFLALGLSRKYGSLWDKTVVAMAPTSAAPPWFYGIILILIFAAILKILPFGGLVDAPPPPTRLGYALSVLKHMILPLMAWIMSGFFITVYNWRTFFLIYSSEDYVEMARAKGVAARAIERRYILRPTLPTIITSFALMLISAWMGAIITETVFNWPGLGQLFYAAISAFDSPVIVGETVLYAYLLAITVFFLDIIYALVDPRIKVGAKGGGL